MPIHVLFDIDHTLIVAESSVLRYSSRYHYHLEKIPVKMYNQLYYIINRLSTEKLFHDLIDNGIKIGFITSSTYAQEICLDLFECIYNLPLGSLKDSVYINRNDYTEHTSKIDKIKAAQNDKIIDADDQIVLIDDLDENINSAKKAGITTVLATGFKVISGIKRPRIDNKYIDDVRIVCGIL